MTFNETIQAVLNASSNHKAEQLLFSTIHTVPERAVMFYALKSRLDIAAAKDEELANKLDADETFSPELLDEAMQNQLVLSRLHFLFGRLFRDMELYGEPPAEFGDLKEAPDRFLSLLLVPFAPLWKDGSVNTEKLKNLLADEGAQNIQKFVASVNRSALESPDVLKTLSDEAQSLSFDDIHEFCELYLFNAVQELKAETTFDVSEPLEHDRHSHFVLNTGVIRTGIHDLFFAGAVRVNAVFDVDIELSPHRGVVVRGSIYILRHSRRVFGAMVEGKGAVALVVALIQGHKTNFIGANYVHTEVDIAFVVLTALDIGRGDSFPSRTIITVSVNHDAVLDLVKGLLTDNSDHLGGVHGIVRVLLDTGVGLGHVISRESRNAYAGEGHDKAQSAGQYALKTLGLNHCYSLLLV